MALPTHALDQPTFPQLYERHLAGPLFGPWAQMLVEDTAVAAGECVLDVACGTGIVARLAREPAGPAGKVVGVDVSAQMLEVARSRAPDIDWRAGDAAALPLREAERFQVVACQQGLQFIADRATALREMRRALAPGGCLAVSTWRADDEMPLLRELRRVAERHLGPIVDKRHGLGEPAALEALLRVAGLREVRVKIVSHTIRFPPQSPFLRLNAMALVGMSHAARSLDDARREALIAAIVADSAAIASPFMDAGALAFEARASVALASG